MIIDTSYFVGEITIPNLSQPATKTALERVIANKEAEILEDVLGYELYKLLKASPEVDRFKNIIEGAEFTNTEGKLKKWAGLKNADKQSPIAQLAYYWYQRQNATQTSGIGEVLAMPENSANKPNIHKLVQAYNKGVEMIGNEREPKAASLYNYLYCSGLYPEWDFKEYKYINAWCL